MPHHNYLADVYISYAGNDATDAFENSRDQLVQIVCNELEQRKLRAREYKRDVQYKDSLTSYMNDIADADYIIIVVSKKYLESEYCMYEAIELISKNKRGFREKICPVIMPDAGLFDVKQHLHYVKYWDAIAKEHNKMIEGFDPQKIMGLHTKGINYREISEGVSDFLTRLEDMCQLSQAYVADKDFTKVIEAIIKQVTMQAGHPAGNIASQAAAADALTMMPSMDVAGGDIATISKKANDALSFLIDGLDKKIMDSQQAKNEYIDVQFEELAGTGPLPLLTRNFIHQVRTDKVSYEDHRRSLVISGLSLGLIKKYDAQRAYLLIDFVMDGDAELANRALTGLILALIDKEDYISDDIELKLKKLQKDDDLQKALLMIFFYLGNTDELHQVIQSFQTINFSQFDFFEKTQHWFLPFYQNNPVMMEIENKKLSQALHDAVIFGGLDSVKYAIGMLANSLNPKEIENLKSVLDSDRLLREESKNNDSTGDTLAQVSVLKYLLEFYVYAVNNHDESLVKLIEDEQKQRKGHLNKLVTHHLYNIMLEGNELIKKGLFAEAATCILPVLEEEPKNKEALNLAGFAYYKAGMYAETIHIFERAKNAGLKTIFIYAALGDSYYNTARYEKAIENYTSLLEMQNNLAGIISLGHSYQLQAEPNFEKALAYHLQAYDMEPGHYQNLLCLGDVYAKLNDPVKAFDYYYKAFEINNDNLQLVIALHELLENPANTGHDVNKRLAIYNRYIELQPGIILPYLHLGLAYEEKDPPDPEMALNCYLQAYQLDSSIAYTPVAIGRMYQQLPAPDHQKAMEYFNKALQLEPGNLEAKLHAAWSLFVLGDYEQSRQYYEANIKSDHSNVVYQNLGHLALISHNEPKAKELYKSSLQLFGDKNAFYQSSLTDLEYLQKAGIPKEAFIHVLDEVIQE